MSSTLHHYIITTVTCETVEYDNPNFIWGYIWNVRSAVHTAAQFWKKKELLRAGSLELSLELWRLKTYLNFSYVLLTRALLDFCTAKQTSCQHGSFPTAPLRCRLIKPMLAVVPACSCLIIVSTKGPVPTAEEDLLGITTSSVVCPVAQIE